MIKINNNSNNSINTTPSKVSSSKKKTVTWPSSQMFTIEDVFSLNKTMKEITVRVRLSKEKEIGKIIELGALTGGKGRPEKVYAYPPITSILTEHAKSKKINLADGIERLIQLK